jgi:hypothetical protein
MKLADLDGFKIRVMQSPGFVKAYKTLGANSVPLRYVPCFAGLASEGRRFDKLKIQLVEMSHSAFHERPRPLDAVKRLDRSERS